MSNKKKAKGGGFLVQGTILAAAGIITKIIGMIYRIPMLNIMGLEGQGYYSIAFQVYSLALIISSYSLPLAVSKLVSAREAKGEHVNAFRVFKAAMMFAFVVGSFVTLVILFGGKGIATYVMGSAASVYALQVLAPGLLIVSIMGVLRGYFQGLGSMVPTAISQILEQVVNAIVSVVGASVLLGYGEKMAQAKGDAVLGPAYAAAGGTLGTVAGALIGLLFLIMCYAAYSKVMKRKMRNDKLSVQEDYKYIFKIMLLTIAPVILSTTVYNIGNIIGSSMFNNLSIAQGLTPEGAAEQLGKLDQYYTLFNVPLAVANSLGASMMPALVAACESRDKKFVHNRIYISIRFTMLIAIPSAFGFLALGKPIMDLIWPSLENSMQGNMMRIGAISLVLYSLSTVTNAVLQGLSHMMKPVKNAAISQVMHTVALFVMVVVFKWGVYSLIGCKIVFSMFMCFLNARDIRKVIGYKQEKERTFIIPAMAGAFMGLFAFATHYVLDILVGGRIATVVAILFAIVVYLISLLKLGGLTEDELIEMPKGRTLLRLFKKFHLMKTV